MLDHYKATFSEIAKLIIWLFRGYYVLADNGIVYAGWSAADIFKVWSSAKYNMIWMEVRELILFNILFYSSSTA